MRFLIIIFLFSGVLACCCTTTPLIIAPISVENRQVDSCEVFLRRLRANMIFGIGSTGQPQYAIIGAWAKRSRKYPRLFNVAADFIDYKSCIIGLTLRELRDMIGEPSYIRTGYNTYFYIREDTSDVHTPSLYRHGCISVKLHDTIRTVEYWGDCIRID